MGIPCTSARDDTLRCSHCHEWLPDDAYSPSTARISRRQRQTECRNCHNARVRHHRRTRGQPIIIDDFVTRTPDQQGRAVPIFAPYPTKVRER